MATIYTIYKIILGAITNDTRFITNDTLLTSNDSILIENTDPIINTVYTDYPIPS